MPTAVSRGKYPVDVEDFPKGTKRSNEGALRLYPGIPARVTGDEAEVLKGMPLPVTIHADPPARPAPPLPKLEVKKSKPKTKTSSAKKGKGDKGKKAKKPTSPFSL